MMISIISIVEWHLLGANILNKNNIKKYNERKISEIWKIKSLWYELH